jgi:hypothetical protein
LAEIPGGVEDLMKELLKVTNTSSDKIASNITESHDVAAKDSNARCSRPQHALGPTLTKQRPMTCVAIAAPGRANFCYADTKTRLTPPLLFSHLPQNAHDLVDISLLYYFKGF